MTNNNAIFGHLKIHLKFMYVTRHWPFWKLKTSIESKIELIEFELFRPFLSSQSCWKFNRSLLEVLLPIVIVIIESYFTFFSHWNKILLLKLHFWMAFWWWPICTLTMTILSKQSEWTLFPYQKRSRKKIENNFDNQFSYELCPAHMARM